MARKSKAVLQAEAIAQATTAVAAVPAAQNFSADVFAQLVKAFTDAIASTKPVEKKNAINRKPGTPWTPKDGSPKIKLRRKFYQHGLLIDPDMMSNEDISLMNQVKPGVYMNGHMKVIRRRDKGINLTYPVSTAAQRLKLNQFGVTSFSSILRRCIEESENPAKYVVPEDEA